MRVQVDERPRMESTRISSMARWVAASGWFVFQRSRPSRAACLSGELAMVMSGWVETRVRRGFGAESA